MIRLYTGSSVVSGSVVYKATLRSADDRLLAAATSPTSIRLATQAALKLLKTMYDTAVAQAVAGNYIKSSTDL